MIKKLFIQLLFIGFSSFAFSQEMTVTGFVTSEQDVGLTFVKVLQQVLQPTELVFIA